MANCAGFDIEDRTEVAAVGDAVRKLPIKDRFAAFPTFNHPLLLNGRKMVLGYPGHLWTQGFDYAPVEQQLKALMLGGPDWRDRARTLRARYIFWGRERKEPTAPVSSLGGKQPRSSQKVPGARFTTSNSPLQRLSNNFWLGSAPRALGGTGAVPSVGLFCCAF
jgi:hypothetical protein